MWAMVPYGRRIELLASPAPGALCNPRLPATSPRYLNEVGPYGSAQRFDHASVAVGGDAERCCRPDTLQGIAVRLRGTSS